MNKTIITKLIVTLFGLTIIAAGFILAFNVGKEEKPEEPVVKTDSEKFKDEYEAYNNKELEGNPSLHHREVTIDKENPIKYASASDIEKLFKDNASFVIYMGFPTCPWCRNAIGVLLDVAKSRNINDIKYINIYDMRTMWTVKDDKLEVTRKGTDDYYKLLELFDSILDDYYYETDDNKYETGEKRIYAPTVVFVKDGEIVGSHVATVTLNEDQTPYDVILDDQKEELSKIYGELFDKVYKTYCDDAC